VTLDIWKVASGAVVGFTVGLTGMGGGALMTPMLILFFGVNPGTAVSSDLLTSLVMKPVGGAVHFRQGTIRWPLVGWLCAGSVPAAFAGVFVLKRLGSGAAVQNHIKTLLGWALLVAAVSMVAKIVLSARSARSPGPTASTPHGPPLPSTKRVATALIGVAGGFIVGMTSVGSGSLMIVMLLLLYPRLTARELVGTDLVQAIPLVASATLSHALFGQIDLGLTGALLLGALPGVYLGARVSSRAPDALIRPALILILLGSALKLLSVQNAAVVWTLGILTLVALPLWGATDASLRGEQAWRRSGYRRTTWVTAQAAAAPFGIGFVVSVWYFAAVRRALRTGTGPGTNSPAPPPLTPG